MAKSRKEGEDQDRAVTHTYEVEFVETVRYRVKFKSKKLFDEHTFDAATGVETWFTEMNEDAPSWATHNLLEVEDRQVAHLRKLR